MVRAIQILIPILLLLPAGCGELETVELDLLKPPVKMTPDELDAGVSARDASAQPAADIVPNPLEFHGVIVGGSAERTLQAINRTDHTVVVYVLPPPEAFTIVGATGHELSPHTSREIRVRFTPRGAGVHDEQLEIDTCGSGCIYSVRLIGLGAW